MNFVGLTLDSVATIIYFLDYLKLRTDISYLLEMLEVKNYDEVYPVLKDNEDIALDPASIPSMLLAFTTGKMFLPLLILLMLGLLSIKSMWEVIDENKRIQTNLRRI